MTANLSIALVCASPGQEYYPVIEDRVEGVVVQPQLVESDEDLRGGWDFAVIVSAAYDDNIFLSSDNPESAMTFRVAPTVAYTQGDDANDGGEGGFIRVAYRPTAVVYTGFSGDNRVDHQALATAGWRGKVTRVTYAGAFQKLGDATPDTGLPTDRVEYENELRGAWDPREKISLEAAVGYNKSDYKDPVYFDSSDTYGEVAVRYAYSPKTELGVAYRVGRFRVDGRGTQDTQRVSGIFVWQPREKIRVDLDLGAEYRRYDNGSRVRPVLEGRIDWTPRKGTEVYLAAYMRELASAFYEGQNYSVKGVSAGITNRLGGDWSIELEGGYETNDYDQVSGTGSGGREDRLWFVRPALVRRMGDESELSIFYRISDNDSNDSGFGYEQQMLGIELNHKF